MKNNTREEILKKTAEELQQPLETVEKVVSWSFKDANKAFKQYSQIEISGFGKFLISQTKLGKRIKRAVGYKLYYEKRLLETEDESEIQKITRSLEALNESLGFYYSKVKVKKDEIQ